MTQNVKQTQFGLIIAKAALHQSCILCIRFSALHIIKSTSFNIIRLNIF